MSPRATPLPPDERRAQILAVSEPLVLEHGSRVTTRQIADAAGVAEGTLFRIFPTKADLLHEVIFTALDPGTTIEALAEIDPEADLDVRLAQTIDVLRHQVQRVSGLMVAMRDLANEHHGRDPERMKQAFGARNDELTEAVVAVLTPDADRLRLPVADVAAWIRGVILVSSHPMMRPGPVETAALTDVLLHGIARPRAAKKTSPAQPAKDS